MPETIRVICGPTAAGKSAIAMWLAGRGPVTIISADSRQIYRGFDIGTAKPGGAEQARVPHRGIDVAAPGERWSAAAWAAAAAGWIDEARAAGRLPLVVGGTGFYLRALFAPLFEEPALPADRRRALEAVLASLSLAELRRWCTAIDPERAHLGRAQLLRALEVALLGGRRLSALHRTASRAARFSARYLVVDPGPALATRIAVRVGAMMDAGWEREVRRLADTIPADAPAWNATGYRAIRALTAGDMERTTAIEQVVIATRQYAKRQRTWFRHQLAGADVTHLNPDDPRRDELVARWWSGQGAT
ncbi:MAG TPA: tRNA (adenosine(37)-N6)-dimethylallyltransferase MiaA [Gemmatimonadaceae bacterium]|nr:tRNA (adenosine(37)-N6)-dimethylallyltransferase MiaA [Gemmatimonadaceae bacterium]